MKYDDFRERSHLSQEEVLAFAYGRLIEDGPPDFKARLPLPPMLMVDRIEHLSRNGRKGRVVAERDVRVLRMVAQHEKEGFGACSNHYECEAACPKTISVNFIARMNRDFIGASLRHHDEPSKDGAGG